MLVFSWLPDVLENSARVLDKIVVNHFMGEIGNVEMDLKNPNENLLFFTEKYGNVGFYHGM